MRTRIFYGWVVVGALFVILMTSSGLGFYNMTLYLRTIVDEHGFSVGAVSGATALFFVVVGLTGVPIASLLGRVDVRVVVVGGAVLAAIALLLLGHVGALWHVYAVYALFATGFSACAMVPAVTVLARWFHRKRAVALSVASTGLSVGGIVLTPLSARLIEAEGLAGATPWLALAFLVGVVPVALALLRPDPAARGLRPDGGRLPEGAARVRTTLTGSTREEALRTRFFRAVTAAYVLIYLAQVGAIAHLFSLGAERTDRATASLAVSVLAGASVVGRLAGGWIAPRVRLLTFTQACVAGQLVGCLVFAVADGRAAFLSGAAVLGLSVGNVLMLHPLLLVEEFGAYDYARIYSLSQLVGTIGLAGGPALLGLLHDWSGGYAVPFLVAAAASVAAGVCLAAAGRPGGPAPVPVGVGTGAETSRP